MPFGCVVLCGVRSRTRGSVATLLSGLVGGGIHWLLGIDIYGLHPPAKRLHARSVSQPHAHPADYSAELVAPGCCDSSTAGTTNGCCTTIALTRNRRTDTQPGEATLASPAVRALNCAHVPSLITGCVALILPRLARTRAGHLPGTRRAISHGRASTKRAGTCDGPGVPISKFHSSVSSLLCSSPEAIPVFHFSARKKNTNTTFAFRRSLLHRAHTRCT